MRRDDARTDQPQDDFPDAYLSVTLSAAPEGISLGENEHLKGTVVTWNGRHAGTVVPGSKTGEYRYSPNASGRCLGGVLTTLQLMAAVPRFAATRQGPLVAPPDRSWLRLELPRAASQAWPSRKRDGANGQPEESCNTAGIPAGHVTLGKRSTD